MAEEEIVFTSKVKYNGIFSVKDFYLFCHNWLTEEIGLDITEDKYAEKLSGDTKSIDVKWSGKKEITDYFRFDIKVDFIFLGLKKVEITKNGTKFETNSGSVEVKVKGILTRDYKGKFETTPFNKFLRSIYEKWVITSRIEEFQNRIAEDSDEFLTQAKSFLDLEGKKA
jgi:hypothetical protein